MLFARDDTSAQHQPMRLRRVRTSRRTVLRTRQPVRVLPQGLPNPSLQEGSSMKPTISRGASAAAAALLVLAAACSDARDPLSPKLQAWNQPPPPQTGEISGTGTIRSGGVITFSFDVTSDASGVHGRFHAMDASGDMLDASSFTGFRSSSSFCATPSHGAEFDAVGPFLDGGVMSTAHFTVKACDNGVTGLGTDTFSIDIRENGFHADDTVVGDITKH